MGEYGGEKSGEPVVKEGKKCDRLCLLSLCTVSIELVDAEVGVSAVGEGDGG